MILRAGFLAMLSLTFASAATGSPQIFGGGVISMPVNVAAPAFAPGGVGASAAAFRFTWPT